MKKVLNVFSLILILAGAINWGLWGFFQFDFVAWLCKGNTNWLARLIYAIIGLGGVWGLRLLGMCKHLCCCDSCEPSSKDKGGMSGGGCCQK
jgi:uncharacterized membrane protein YuzA (DUF378 family)